MGPGAGLEVNVWTVNAVDEARRLADLGVDALITDVPDILIGALAEKVASTSEMAQMAALRA